MGERVNRAIGRIPNQFVNSTRWVQYLRSLVVRLEDVDSLLGSLATLRWIGTATGVWLDNVGEIVGIPRFYEELVDGIFTYKDAFPGTDDPDLAYSNYPGPAVGGRYQDLDGLFTDTLIDDDTYRNWIIAKAAMTGSGGTIRDIYTFIKNAFDAETLVTTGGTREVEVFLVDPLTQGQRLQLLRWAPVAAGVSIVITN